MKYIYADYAATTPTDKRVMKIAQRFFSKKFANPSSSHALGVEMKEVLTEARKKTAEFFNCLPEEIIFTSSGTESENLAMKGIGFSCKNKGKHIIISSIEHASVYSSASFLEKQGFEISRIAVGRSCIIDVEAIEAAIRDDTTLISVMYVNNEVGSIQPIALISDMLKRVNSERQKFGKHSIYLHVDGEAGSIYMLYDVKQLGVDSMSVNGSKVYSLKGASALYIRKGIGIATQICGGGQEFLIRGGTENVPAIAALAEALNIADNERSSNTKKILEIKNKLRNELEREITGSRVNTPDQGAPNILHVTFLGYNKIDIVGEMSKLGVFVSSGSACSSNKNEEKSRVLQAIGFNENEIDMSIRFSLGKLNKISDVKYIVNSLKKILKK